jgi:F-type H+-transporting ATPase subunit gamma
MPSLKEVRTRISSVISTKQITSAMKMVSASKLRRAQMAILKLRPYAQKLTEILGSLKSSIENTDEAAFFKERKVNKVLLVVLTSNRGLCGAFNSNSIKLAVQTIHNDYQEQFDHNNVFLICIGKKAQEYFTRRKYQVVESYNYLFDSLTYDNSMKVSKVIMDEFIKGTYDKVDIIYNQFKNAAVQVLIREQFLPVIDVQGKQEQKDNTDYIFEPDKTEIVRELVPRSLKVQLYKTLLDSLASEHGARMTAMHKATENGEEILKELKRAYNQARQANITKEILEIISGANALKG